MAEHPSLHTFKFCPNCGNSTIKAVSEKSSQCSHCHFLFYWNPASAVTTVIYNENKEILLLKRAHQPKKDFWDLPGGFVDPFETLENAVMREIKEELKVDLTQIQYFYSCPNVYQYRNITYQTTDAAFQVFLPKNTPIELDEENQSFQWFAHNDLPWDTLAFDSCKNILKKFFS